MFYIQNVGYDRKYTIFCKSFVSLDTKVLNKNTDLKKLRKKKYRLLKMLKVDFNETDK